MTNINVKKKTKNFIDISLSFEPNPITGDITLLKNERAINQALKNIILFSPGEVAFRHDIGSGITEYLFENADAAIAGLIDQEIRRAIGYNEPRVEVLDVNVEAQPSQYQFSVSITYKIVGYDQSLTFTQILRSTRESF